MSSESLNNELKTLDQLYNDYIIQIIDKTKAISYKTWSKCYDICKTPKEYETKIQKMINETNKTTTIKNLEEKIKMDENNKNNGSDIPQDILKILSYCRIESSNLRKDAFNHWKLTLEFLKDNDKRNYTSIRTRLRGVVGIDFRYIDSFIDTFKDWEIIDILEGNLIFKGIPKEEKIDAKT